MSPDKDVTITEEEKQESLLWEEYLEEGEYDYQRPKRGEIRDGIILRKDEDQIIVDIGAKREGIVPQKDLEKIGPETVAELSVGDEISVYVLSPESRDGDVIVSINMARQMADWDQAEKLMRSDEILEKKVTGFNKGGILVQVGQIQGFIPRSHIVDLSGRTKPGTPQERLSQMIGQELPLKIIEVNRRQRRLILSERAAWREWRAEQKKRLLAGLEVNDVRTGTVTSLAEFGAFVDLGGADGLIHLSELSWDRGKKPSDALRVGDEVEVKIISLDRERKRIGLSMKQLKPNPWDTIEERYAVDQYIDVEVTNLAKFGAFARLEEGLEGLIHISELADHGIQHPSEVVAPGQVLTVQILSLAPQRKRVGLSLRRVPEHLRPQVEAEEEAETVVEPEAVAAEGVEPAEAVLEQTEAAVEPEEPEAVAAEGVEPAEAAIAQTEATAEPEEPEAVAAESVEPAEAAIAQTEATAEPEEPEAVAAEGVEPAEAAVAQTEATAEPEEPREPAGPITVGEYTDEPAQVQAAEASLQQPIDIAQNDEPVDAVEDEELPEQSTQTPAPTATAAGMNGDNVPEEDIQAAPSSGLSREPQAEHQG
ncbi:MAG: S1 RNA-binding domain-containing protein [Anaerolineae bacterium]